MIITKIIMDRYIDHTDCLELVRPKEILGSSLAVHNALFLLQIKVHKLSKKLKILIMAKLSRILLGLPAI